MWFLPINVSTKISLKYIQQYDVRISFFRLGVSDITEVLYFSCFARCSNLFCRKINFYNSKKGFLFLPQLLHIQCTFL